MKERFRIGRSRLYRRTLLSYMLIFSIPLFIFSIVMYNRNNLSREQALVLEREKKKEFIVRNLDNQFYQIYILGKSMVGSNWLNKAFSRAYTIQSLPLTEKRNIIQMLNTYSAINSFSQDFALFLTQKDAVVNKNALRETDEYFRSIGIMDETQQDDFQEFIQKAAHLSIINRPENGLAIIQKVDVISTPRAVLYIPLDMERIYSYLEQLQYGDLYRLSLLTDKISSVIYAPSYEVKDEKLVMLEAASYLYNWTYQITFQKPLPPSLF